MSYKLRALRNRILHSFVKERSVRFALVSFLFTLLWGIGLAVFVIGDGDVFVMVIALCFFPVTIATKEAYQVLQSPSASLVRWSSFTMAIVFITATTFLCLHTWSVLPDALTLVFLVNILAVASTCVRPRIKEDVVSLRKWGRDLIFLVCAERLIVWPITCTTLAISDIALGIGGEIQLIIAVLLVIFFLSFFYAVKETLGKLRLEE